MLGKLLSLSAVALSLPLCVLAGNHGSLLNRQHHTLSKRAENVTLAHRASGARMSFYDVETGSAGSCGLLHKNSDFTVALSAAQMNPSLCFKSIRITYNGVTSTADITDTCPGCPPDGLDLTPGLFSSLASQSAGIIYADWVFADAVPAPAPTPSYTPPPPTTSATPPPPSTTSTPPPSSSAPPSSAPTSSAASSAALVASSSGSLAVPTTAPVASNSGEASNLASVGQAAVQLGGMAAVGHNY